MVEQDAPRALATAASYDNNEGIIMRRGEAAARNSIGRRRQARLALAIVVAIAGAATAGLAAAQTPPPPPPESAAGLALQEIVVTATRHEEVLSKVPISVTAITQEGMDLRGIKDFQDVARFTPGVNIDKSGTNNISIRGIASSGGAGTTGIYIDDTPIQIRALAFDPDDALPKSFDIDRVEVLRGPQGTLFGAGSEGGTVRYITTQPSLTKSSIYSRSEISYTQGGEASYEAGVAVGGPVVDNKLGARVTVWYRRDGGWIDRIDPVTLATLDKNANRDGTMLVRLAAIWAASERWTATPSIYYQDRQRNDVSNYWPLYSDPSRDKFVSANPTQRSSPDTFYLPALKIEGDFGAAKLISNTSYYHRKNTTGYDGTLYNLGFYQTLLTLPNLLLDGSGVHLPPGLENYRSPASVQNGQQNITQEIRLQSTDPNARLIWTTGLFFTANRQSYLEQINDPLAGNFFQQLAGSSVGDFFSYCPLDKVLPDGSCPAGVAFIPVPLLANGDSYLLSTRAEDRQIAWFGEGAYAITDELKATVGLRFSKTKFSFNTYTAGPQLFGPAATLTGAKSENSFTPKVDLSWQMNPNNLLYTTYAKGFRPGGANNPVPQAACAADFASFGLTGSPATFNSDTVDSFEVGAKNNFSNRIKIASSVYYIKWNNIQQTVIPPICQISFIANLGQAVAKGADVQADVAVTDSLTMEFSAGYTDARYTKDSKFTSLETTPVVSKGDAIVGQSSELSGQPGAPFTASLGLEYKFRAFDHEAFVRTDYQYEGRAKWPSARQDGDPTTCTGNTLQFDCANFTLNDTNFVTVRGGVTFSAWSVAAFIDNLTDTHALTSYNFTIDPGAVAAPSSANAASRLRRDYTFRPRTFGLTFTYRN
jgi:outer membrane receptor protein involved in Fe transport